MASKTIMIDSEVYENLKKLKKDKSFSEIIRELIIKRNTPPKSSLGILKDEPDKIDYLSINVLTNTGKLIKKMEYGYDSLLRLRNDNGALVFRDLIFYQLSPNKEYLFEVRISGSDNYTEYEENPFVNAADNPNFNPSNNFSMTGFRFL